MSEPTRIVILGGGFAGTATALRLEQLFRRDPAVEVTLVDGENFSLFTPLLPEVPSGSLQAKHIVYPLRAALRHTAVRQAEVREVDRGRATRWGRGSRPPDPTDGPQRRHGAWRWRR